VIDESGANAGNAASIRGKRRQLGLLLNEENRNLEILIVDHASQAPPDR
jgi:hypothetical protein